MKAKSLFLWSALSLLLAFSLIGVSQLGPSAPQILELATTTSTVDSGLLNALHPPFDFDRYGPCRFRLAGGFGLVHRGFQDGQGSGRRLRALSESGRDSPLRQSRVA